MNKLYGDFEKEYAIKRIKSTFKEDNFLPKDTVKRELLNKDLENVVDDMLKYAIEIGLLRADGDYYELNR